MTHDEAMRTLTDYQLDVLGWISMGKDGGHSDRTLAKLARLGLIVGRRETLPGHPPVTITRWSTPLDVHMAWCAFCAELGCDEEET